MTEARPLYAVGKIYQPRHDFVVCITSEARKLYNAERGKSRRQWAIARAVLPEWRYIEEQFEREIRKEYFYMETSRIINTAMPYPLLTDTGETLRRWCDVVAPFEFFSLKELEDVIPFEWFRLARQYSKLPKNEAAGYTAEYIITKTYNERWNDEGMRKCFSDDGAPTHDYDKAIGWFDSLMSIKWAWIKDKTDRERVRSLLSEARKIAERYK